MTAPTWTWHDKLSSVKHDKLDQFINDSVASEPCSIDMLLSLYDSGTPEQRELIDRVTIALTGWSMESLLNHSQGVENNEDIDLPDGGAYDGAY